jgi:glycylpeptide N-tetradecanoyltransferase
MTKQELLADALVLAKRDGADVYNALDLADNLSAFTPLKFGSGDGCLQYYLYNWKCAFMKSEDVGLVLL